MPCIFFIKVLFSPNIIKPAAIGIIVKIIKNVEIEYCWVMPSIRLPVRPASVLAMKVATNQIPNINPTIFTGESLLIYESPTGETQSSPKV